MTDIPDWNELARSVSAVRKFIQPLLHLEKMPEAVEAARIKVAESEDAVRRKQEDISKLNKEINTLKLEVQKVSSDYQAAKSNQDKELKEKYDQLRDEYEKGIQRLVRDKQNADKVFKENEERFQKQKTEHELELQNVRDKVEDERRKLKELQDTISKLLNMGK